MTIGIIVHASMEAITCSEVRSRRRDFYADAARVFGAELSIVDNSGLLSDFPESVLTLDAALELHMDSSIVQLCVQGDTHLAEFDHPKEPVVYVVGPDMEAELVSIPGAEMVTIGEDVLWSHQAIVIALWDRAVKLGIWPLL